MDSSQRTWTIPHVKPLVDDDGGNGDVTEVTRSSGLSEGDGRRGQQSGSTDSAAPVGSGHSSALLTTAAAVCCLAQCVLDSMSVVEQWSTSSATTASTGAEAVPVPQRLQDKHDPMK